MGFGGSAVIVDGWRVPAATADSRTMWTKPISPCVVDVRPTTEFGAERGVGVSDLDDADIGAVLVAEEGQRAAFNRLAVAGRAPGDLKVVAHLLVRDLLGFGERGPRSLFEVGKVEPQAVRRDE